MTSNFNVLEYRKKFHQENIGTHYSGLLHVFFSTSCLVGTSLFCLYKLNNLTGLEYFILPFMLLFGNFTVYFIHKYLLHRRIPYMGSAYRRHTIEHHHYFTDEFIVVSSSKEFRILLFPPEIVIFVSFIWGPLVFWFFAKTWSLNAGYLFWLGHCIYFVLYEVFHFTSHLPTNHWALKFRPFAYMREHHKLHHNPKLMAQYNFNIVYPMSDLIFKSQFKK